MYAYLIIVVTARKVMRRRFAQRRWRLARMVPPPASPLPVVL